MMTTSRMALLVLVSIVLGGATASLAQDKCSSCLTRETNDCIKQVGSSPPPATTPNHPGPVQASGASYCPGEAQRRCGLRKEC